MRYIAAVVLVVLAAVAGGDRNSAATEAKIVAKLQAENSKQNGAARLTQQGGALLVEIRVNGAMGAEPATIYRGSCSKVGKLANALSAVSGGRSTTTLPGVSLASMRAGSFAVVIHASAADLARYVSCGDVGRGAHLTDDTTFNSFGGRMGQ